MHFQHILITTKELVQELELNVFLPLMIFDAGKKRESSETYLTVDKCHNKFEFQTNQIGLFHLISIQGY